MADYKTADFNDPAVCKSVHVTNSADLEKLWSDQFLSFLKNGLRGGLVQPNSACLDALQEITSLPLPHNSIHKETQTTARNILDGFFYSLIQPQSLQDESKAEVPNLPSYLQKNNQLTEWTGLQSDLAGILGGYYSTCALATEDGKYCGLGQGNGFRFPYPSASTSTSTSSSSSTPIELVDCRHECTGDLCEQWMTSLTSRVPTVVTITTANGQVTNAEVEIVEIESSDGNLYFVFEDGKLTDPPANFSGACRVLNAPRKIDLTPGYGYGMPIPLTLVVTVDLKSIDVITKLNQLDPTQIRVSFPEFEGNKYFVGDNSLWGYKQGSWYATLTIPPRA